MSTRTKWILAAIVVLLLLGGGAVVVTVMGSSEAARLAGLQPHVRARLQELRARLEALGIKTFVGQTLRNGVEQAARVKTGNSATQNSWHLLGRAVDLYPIIPGTKDPDLNGKHVELFRTMHTQAVQFGFRGLAFNSDGTKRYLTTSAGKIWDGGHLEFPDGMTWAAASTQYQKSKIT